MTYKEYRNEWFRRRVAERAITLDSILELMESYACARHYTVAADYLLGFGFPPGGYIYADEEEFENRENWECCL